MAVSSSAPIWEMSALARSKTLGAVPANVTRLRRGSRRIRYLLGFFLVGTPGCTRAVTFEPALDSLATNTNG